MPFIHKTAIVETPAIGKRTKIWHWTHVMPKVRIGEDCILGQNVFVGNNVIIGDKVKIQNNVSLYDGVIIENCVFIGPSVVFTNVKHPRADQEQKDNFRTTLVRRGAVIGANATIICGVEIGSGAFVGAGAVVTKNVLAGTTVVGNPAKELK